MEKEIARNEKAQLGRMLVPSPDGRYLAAVDVTRWADDFLWVYDTQTKTWVNLGKAFVHPEIIYTNNDWDWKNAQPQWTFWGNTTIWVVPVEPRTKARVVTHQSPEEVHTLRWLNNNEIVFDRSLDTQFYSNVRVWKVRIE